MDTEEGVTISPEPVALRLTGHAPTVLMKTNLWNNWARIAIEHEREAIAAREELKRVWSVPHASRDILTEMHPAMVCIVACALAFDALHADVAPVVGRDPDPRGKGKRQWVYMLETFTVALPTAAKWHAELSWLISQRDNAVHFRGISQEPIPHPELPTNVSPQNVEFSKETATRAVNLLFRIFGAVLAGPELDGAARQMGSRPPPRAERARTTSRGDAHDLADHPGCGPTVRASILPLAGGWTPTMVPWRTGSPSSASCSRLSVLS